MCAIQCTKEEICNVLGVTDKTLDNWCKETYNQYFSVVFNQKRDGGKTSLRRHQWKLAESGNATMLIWLGKQRLGQSENHVLDEIKKEELEIKKEELKLRRAIVEHKINKGEADDELLSSMLKGLTEGLNVNVVLDNEADKEVKEEAESID